MGWSSKHPLPFNPLFVQSVLLEIFYPDSRGVNVFVGSSKKPDMALKLVWDPRYPKLDLFLVNGCTVVIDLVVVSFFCLISPLGREETQRRYPLRSSF